MKIHNRDCRAVLAELPPESVDLLVTDPPYLVGNRGGMGKGGDGWCMKGIFDLKSRAADNIKAGKLFEHNDIAFDEWLPECYRVMKRGTHAYIMITARNMCDLRWSAERSGFVFQNILVWNKITQTYTNYYMQQVEYILMLSKKPARAINNRGMSTLITIPNPRNKQHPTEKPVALMELLINNSSDKGDLVIDPFVGAGATALACVTSGRRFVGCEIDPEYWQVATDRVAPGIARQVGLL